MPNEFNPGAPPTVTDLGNGRVWPADAEEISGMGGAYEDQCRRMLKIALTWVDEHPDANLKFQGMRGVFGIVQSASDDAKALDEVISKIEGGCSGAMHHAVINHTLYIKTHGWDAFIAEKRARKARHEPA